MATEEDQGKQSSEAMAFRQALRRERIAAREALPEAEHGRLSTQVIERLRPLLETRPVGVLALYWPVRAEVDCRPLVPRLMAAGWRVCLPAVVARAAALEFREWTPAAKMAVGAYGIPCVESGPSLQPDVLLLPVNAFDRQGYRLGYGGGYYDRTLSTLHPRPFSIGIGFDLARTDSIFPHAQDCGLDAVVTESDTACFPVPLAERPKDQTREEGK